MHLSRLGIQNLRCLQDVPELPLHPKLNLITGANAAGKTSFLEAIDLLARGRSFRSAKPRELITHGATNYLLRGQVERENPTDKSESERFYLSQSRSNEQLELRRDREPLKGLAELASLLAVQVIHPESQQLIHGVPARRRAWLDWGVFHVEPEYRPLWARYQRALKQRNIALKTRTDPHAWDQPLAEAGERMDVLRQTYLDEVLDSILGYAQIMLPEHQLECRYRPGFDREQGLLNALTESREPAAKGDFATQVGPHRADVELLLEGVPAVRCASRGQTRLLACCLLLGQVAFFQEMRNENCVLLVDDLNSELDADRQSRLMEALSSCEAQLFASSLGRATPFPEASAGQMFHVEQGVISLT